MAKDGISKNLKKLIHRNNPHDILILREYALLNFYDCYSNTNNNNAFQNL